MAISPSRTSHRSLAPRRPRWPAALAALGLLVALPWANAAPTRPAADATLGRAAEARAAATRDAAWWQGFHDPALTSLMARSNGDATRTAAIAQAWIAAQVFHVQAVTTAEIARTARAEQALLMNAPPDTPRRDELLAVMARRLEGADDAESDRLARRNEQLERLNDLTGLTPAALAELVKPRLDALALPQFDAPVPTATDGLDATVLNDIQRLEDHQSKTVQALAAARALQQQYQALRDSDPAEPDAQIAVLQSYQRMLLQGQQVAASSGDLALAWLRLLQAHGGRLGAYGVR